MPDVDLFRKSTVYNTAEIVPLMLPQTAKRVDLPMVKRSPSVAQRGRGSGDVA